MQPTGRDEHVDRVLMIFATARKYSSQEGLPIRRCPNKFGRKGKKCSGIAQLFSYTKGRPERPSHWVSSTTPKSGVVHDRGFPGGSSIAKLQKSRSRLDFDILRVPSPHPAAHSRSRHQPHSRCETERTAARHCHPWPLGPPTLLNAESKYRYSFLLSAILCHFLMTPCGIWLPGRMVTWLQSPSGIG